MFNSRYILGAALIFLGAVFLLNNLDVIDVSVGELVRTYWPVLLLAWGVSLLPRPGRGVSSGQVVSAGIVLVLGIVFLARNLGWIDADLSVFWRAFWPIVIIFAGLSLLRGRVGSHSKSRLAFMGGIELNKSSWNLQNNESFFAVMGGIDLDLRNAEIPPGEVLLDLTAVMGGIDVIVPQHLPVVCEATTVLGGVDFRGESSGGIIASRRFESHTAGAGSGDQVLRIQARAIMGGVSIK